MTGRLVDICAWHGSHISLYFFVCIAVIYGCDRTPDNSAGHMVAVGADPGSPGPAPAETPDLAFRNITDWAGISVPAAAEQGASFIDADRDGIDDVH